MNIKKWTSPANDKYTALPGFWPYTSSLEIIEFMKDFLTIY